MNALRLTLFLAGLIFLFVVERYFAADALLVWLRGAAFALLVAGCVLSLVCRNFALKSGLVGEAKGWTFAFWWKLTVLVGCLVWLLWTWRMGTRAVPDTFELKALLASWLILVVLGLAAGTGVEWTFRQSGRGALAEPHRVAKGGASWLVVGMLLVILACVNWAAVSRDKSWDWSYLKVSSPSESTMQMVGTLTGELKIGLFYPPGNEVRQYVEQYFGHISSREGKVKVSWHDKDMDPGVAEAFKVSRNGQIVFDLDGKQERIDTGLKLAGARGTLRKLDAEFQKVFLALTAARKTAYFTRGHGELSWLAAKGEDERANALRSLRVIEGDLRNLNYGLRLFGVSEGSAREIPDDASLIVIAGPTEPFLQEEVDVLKAWLNRGGKLMVLLDVETAQGDLQPINNGGSDPLRKLLEEIGITWVANPLANERNHVRLTNSPSDVWFLFTNSFTSHESVSVLARHEERVAMLAYKTGSLSVTPELGLWQNFETVRTLSDTFEDSNRDFKFDQTSEKRNAWVLGTASIRKAPPGEQVDPEAAARVVVFADASAISDALTQNGPNRAWFIDAVRWLSGESKVTGTAQTEEDVKIRHTRKEDMVWFYGTVVAMPLLVLGAGFVATRGSGRRGRRSNGK
jgi:hypothetical protein